MTTALDIIQDSLEKIGVYAPGETITDADAERALTVLNDMLDSWSNEALSTFAFKTYNFTMVGGKFQYTVGTGGDIDQPRPIRVLTGPGQATITDDNGNRYMVDVVPEDSWNQIWNWGETGNNQSNIPATLYYDAQYPLGIININPVPTIGWSMAFVGYLALADLNDLTASVSMPPGYIKALKDNLAIEAWPYFKTDNSTPSPLLMKIAAQSKANVKRSNTRENWSQVERVLTDQAGAVFNPYSDSYR